MLYFELGLCDEDYLTEKELKLFWRCSRFVCNVKSFFGIIVKKKIGDRVKYVFPKVNEKYLKKIKRILKVSGEKQVCISDELLYKNEFLNLMKQSDVQILNGKWIFNYLLEYILKYISEITKDDFKEKEIAFMVNDNYDLAIEYIKRISDLFKLVTVVTNNTIVFSKISDVLLKNEGIDINLINNYRKSMSKSDIIVNIDYQENEIKKYSIYNKAIFINLKNEYEIISKKFHGISITNCQISMPKKYLKYVELFKNYNYLNVYESFIKKKTSINNILSEIEKDKIDIIFLENGNGMIKNEDFLIEMRKILDK